MSYENWAFEGLDELGLVGLHVSAYGLKIVTRAVPRRVLKSYPLGAIQSWNGSTKIFKFSFVDPTATSAGGDGKERWCQLSTTWVPQIMETLDKVVQSIVAKRKSRQMSETDFTAFLEALDNSSDDEVRVAKVLKYAQTYYVTADQGAQALRRIPKTHTFDKIKVVQKMHRHIVDSGNFKLIVNELEPEDRNNAWELIKKGLP